MCCYYDVYIPNSAGQVYDGISAPLSFTNKAACSTDVTPLKGGTDDAKIYGAESQDSFAVFGNAATAVFKSGEYKGEKGGASCNLIQTCKLMNKCEGGEVLPKDSGYKITRNSEVESKKRRHCLFPNLNACKSKRCSYRLFSLCCL